MADFIPGDPLNAELEEATNGLAIVQNEVTAAESVIDDTDAAVVVPIITEIKEAESLCNELAGVCSGEVEVAVSEAEELITKIKAKISDGIDSLMGDIYSDMGLLGYDVPSETDLAYMEGTGNFNPYAGSNEPTTRDTPQPIPSGGIGPIMGPNGPIMDIPVQPGEQCPPGYGLAAWFDGSLHCIYSGIGSPGDTTPSGGNDDGGDYNDPPVIEPPVTQPPCPPGYHPEPITTGGSDVTPVQMRDTIRSESVVACYPPINLPYPLNYSGPPQVTNIGSLIITPWTNQASAPEGLPVEQVCFNGCHLRPAVAGQVCYYVPSGWRLYVRPEDGSTIASNDNVPGYLDVTFVGDNPEPGNGEPPAGGGIQCVPDDIKGSCKPPDELCGDDTSPWPSFPSDSKKEDACEQIDDAISKAEKDTLDFAKFFLVSSGTAKASTLGDAIINAITGGSEPIIVNLMRRFAGWLETTVKEVSNSTACGSPAFVNVAIRRAILRFIDRYTGTVPEQALEATDQISNSICQSKLPSGSEADVAYLADQISEKLWECYHKAEGDFLPDAKKVMLSKRQRVTAREADLLYRRKEIDFEAMRKRMRADGVISDDDLFDIRKLNEQQATVTDIISWMKRDVFDNVNVDWSEADQDFDKKFTEEAEKLADAIGLRRQLAKNSWRAHYQYPSYTMGREFLFRFNDPDLPENLKFDEAAFRNMLKIDDWHPAYIDRMIANAYHPVTRADIVKAFMIHAIDDDEFVKRFKKTGYTEADARFYLGFYKKRRLINDRKSSGFPTMRTAVNGYSRCEITERQLLDLVNKLAIDDDQRDSAIEAARTARDVWERKQTIRTVKRPFLLGIYDEQTARDELNRYDVDPGCVNSLIEQWQRERLRRDKFLSASQLCQMYERGIVTEQTMVLALVRSGWDEKDAVLITANCGAMISEKLAKKARVEAEKQVRELRRIQREQEKAARLAECGPPPCPANRNRNVTPSVAGQ